MILTIDMGNTNIVIGGIDRERTYFVERVTTAHGKTDMEYAISLKSILEIHHISPASIEGAILSSVVPPLNAALSSAVEKICGFRPGQRLFHYNREFLLRYRRWLRRRSGRRRRRSDGARIHTRPGG